MPEILDVFNQSGFDVVSMTKSINKVPYLPKQIAQMGLFEEEGVTQPVVSFEELNGKLALLPVTQRGGAPGTAAPAPKRKMRSIAVPNISYDDQLKASDVQGVREFGTANQLASPERAMNKKLADMAAMHAATLEYHRIGAIKGLVKDADGSTTLYSLFTLFNISAPSDVDFVLGTDTTDVGSLAVGVKNTIEDALGNEPYDHVHAFCGKTFWQKFTAHPEVKWAFQYYQESNVLRSDLRYQGFEYKGIIWQQYRGTVGSVDYVAAADCRFFPVGVPGLFRTYFAPADFMESVNTPGLPMYAKQAPDKFGRGIDIHTQSNPLCVCTRPGTLVRGYTSN